MMFDKGKIFLWKDKKSVKNLKSPSTCKYCSIYLKISKDKCYQNTEENENLHQSDIEYLEKHSEKYECPQCGFWIIQLFIPAASSPFPIYAYDIALLKKFNINNSQVSFDELGSHLKRNFEDIYLLNSRRFEFLVGDIYKNIGYDVRFTQQSRDGGYDIILLEKTSGQQVLIECKRYEKGRKIVVNTVRELLGVQLENQIKQAKIVTTGDFTKPAKDLSNRMLNHNLGFSIELIGANKLLKNLNVYNLNIPPLEVVWEYLYRKL